MLISVRLGCDRVCVWCVLCAACTEPAPNFSGIIPKKQKTVISSDTFPRFDPGSRYLKRGREYSRKKKKEKAVPSPWGKFKIDGVIPLVLLYMMMYMLSLPFVDCAARFSNHATQ